MWPSCDLSYFAIDLLQPAEKRQDRESEYLAVQTLLLSPHGACL